MNEPHAKPLWKIPLTEEQFEKFDFADWKIKELPQPLWSLLPSIHRPNDLVAVMLSGTQSGSRILNGVEAVGGVDFLTLETRRNLAENEPEGNAYHAIFVKTIHPKYPYIFMGAFNDETLVPHWFSGVDLDKYGK